MLRVLQGLPTLAGGNIDYFYLCSSCENWLAYCFLLLLYLVRGTFFSCVYRSVLIQRSAVNLLQSSENLYLCSIILSDILPPEILSWPPVFQLLSLQLRETTGLSWGDPFPSLRTGRCLQVVSWSYGIAQVVSFVLGTTLLCHLLVNIWSNSFYNFVKFLIV